MSDSVRTLRRIPVAHRAPVRLLAGVVTRSSRGVVVSSGRDNLVRAWEADTGVATGFAAPDGGRLIKFVGAVEAGDFAVVIVADSVGYRRFDLGTGRQLGEPARPGRLGVAALLPGGETPLLVAVGSYNMLHRWNALTAAPAGEPFPGPGAEIVALTAIRLPDGRGVIVTSTAEGQIERWDAETGEEITPPLAGHQRPVAAMTGVTGADGRSVVIGQEFQGAIHRWDAATGEPIGGPLSQPQRHPGIGLGSLAVTADATVLFSVDAGGTPWRWDLTRLEPVAESFSPEVRLVNAVTVVPAGDSPVVFTAGEQGDLRRWDLAGRPLRPDPIGHPAAVSQVIPVPSSPYSVLPGVLVSLGIDGARCWNAENGAEVGRPPFDPIPIGYAMAAAWLPDGRLMLAGATDDGLARAEVFSGSYQEEAPDAAEEDDVLDGLSMMDVVSGLWPDGRPFFAAACANGAVRLVDAATGDRMRPALTGLDSSALAVAVTALEDGTVLAAAGGEEQTILRWKAVTGEPVGHPLETAGAFVMRLAFRALPDGRVVLVAVDDASRVYRWDAVSGEPIGETLTGPGKPGESPRLAPNAPGSLIAVGQKGTVRIWDTGTGQVRPDMAEASSATTLTLPDGSIALAVGHIDGSITIAAE
jgi:WD40 repeat protein